MEKKTKKIRQTYIFVFLAILIISSVFCFGSRKVSAFPEGWGVGVWNDLVVLSGVFSNTGTPTTGWLKSNSDLDGPCFAGASYRLYFSSGNPGDSERYVSGKAWFGIGSQPDSGGVCQSDLPSLGWLDFGAGSPSFCSGDDCHAARWHKTGDDNYTGYLYGWAKVVSMGDNGWVRLKGGNYGASSDANGLLSGFVWNSGTESAILGNSGMGWIKTDGLKLTECELSCATKQLCEGDVFSGCDASFCVGEGTSCALEADNIHWTCSSDCGLASCSPYIISPENGVCGSLNGKSVCDPNEIPSDGDLCANGTTAHNFNRSGIIATWTCGSVQCGGSEASCSASTRCGWIETAP